MSKIKAAEATTAINMELGILGLGYVGMANAAVLLSLGHKVFAFEPDQEKVKAISRLNCCSGEDGINKILKKKYVNFDWSSDLQVLNGLAIYIIAVGTPAKENGECDLSQVFQAASIIKERCRKDKDINIIVRSTVEPGTSAKLGALLNDDGQRHFHIISMPEFLAEGTSLENELNPYRIVVGASSADDFSFIRTLRKDAVNRGVPFFEMSNVSAEMTKYASNAFLATKISFANEMSRLSETNGANIVDIMEAVGADPRIGRSMFGAGVGYGGACLPKDSKAIVEYAKKQQSSLSMVEKTIEINEQQSKHFTDLISKYLGDLHGKKIVVAGLAYKAYIDDTRSSIANRIVEDLLNRGVDVNVYDPSSVALKDFKEAHQNVHAFQDFYEASQECDALAFLTKDKAFLDIDENELLKAMCGRFIFDGINLFSLQRFKHFNYISIGRTPVLIN